MARTSPARRIVTKGVIGLEQVSRHNLAGSVANTLDMLVAAEGSGAHRYVQSGKLSRGPDALRNLADAVHFLAALHGRHPGVVDHAARKGVDPTARLWLEQASDAFSGERAFMSALASKVGPQPSTAGQAQCQAAVNGQRHALDMLAQSDRRGCALGAAIALTLDWRTIRVLLDISAERLDMTPPDCTLPSLPDTARLADSVADSIAVERAMGFGAQQLIGQHRGLWDLLDARESARQLG